MANLQNKFRELVSQELSERKARNSAYSLRSFASNLGLSSSSLSEFLNGKRNYSAKKIWKLSSKLFLTPEKKFELQEVIQLSLVGSPIEKQKDHVQLWMDHYFVVADPLYYSFLCLVETVDFKEDDNWIASRLQTTVPIVVKVKAKLLSLGFLSHTETGKLVCIDAVLDTTDDISSSSLRARHQTNMNDASESVQKISVDQRDFIFSTIAINPAQIPEAKKLLREYRAKVCELLESGPKSQVYELCFSLFPRTKL